MKMFPAIILAGGLATRLRPLTDAMPKALMDINGEPFISHQLRLLKKQNVTDIILSIGYRGEMIRDYVGDGSRFGVEVAYIDDGPQLLGTGGAIKNAITVIKNNAFFVLYGDSYLPCDYAVVQRYFVKAGKLGLMTVFHNENKWDTSNIEFINHEIVTYDKTIKTPRMKHIDYGLGILTKESFLHIQDKNMFDLAAFYQLLLKKSLLSAYEIKERFYEVGSLTGIDELRYYFSQLASHNI